MRTCMHTPTAILYINTRLKTRSLHLAHVAQMHTSTIFALTLHMGAVNAMKGPFEYRIHGELRA